MGRAKILATRLVTAGELTFGDLVQDVLRRRHGGLVGTCPRYLPFGTDVVYGSQGYHTFRWCRDLGWSRNHPSILATRMEPKPTNCPIRGSVEYLPIGCG